MAVQARVAVPTPVGKVTDVSWAFAAVVAATVLRLLLIAVPSHGYDSFAYKHWTWRLVHEPLSGFYVNDGQAFPDHLPGDLWLLKLLGTAARMVEPDLNFYGPAYGVLISLLAMTFDGLLALALIAVGRAIGRYREGYTAALLYWCAPAPIFVASVWGQIDTVATTLAICALGLAVARRFSLAFVVLALCVLVKPQFGMLALPLLVGWYRANRAVFPAWVFRVTGTAIACVALLALVSAPFGVSLVGEWGQWSLLERVELANDTYTVSVLGAHNFWILFDSLNWPPDDRGAWLWGFSRQQIGLAMFIPVVMYACWLLAARWRGAITMVLVSNILLFGFFLFMTRMHERYLFPVVALGILLMLMDRRYRNYAGSVNVIVFANIALRFLWPLNNSESGWRFVAGLPWLEHAWFVQALAVFAMVIFGWLAIEGGRRKLP